MILASYASDPAKSKGRQYKESKSASRNDFQRDRDRVIHSASFRRLQYKTQVFVNHEGDMFRSRLTHSLEVSQIARAVARSLCCHEDLCEAIALAHDLGHTPFGHAGQDALNECMKDHDGFEHNLQSLRVVDILENKYFRFTGLNLTYEVREGILKHCSKKNAFKLGEIGKRFIYNQQPSLEAQIVNIADEIAYLHHDIDDGYRSGILSFEKLETIYLFKTICHELSQYHNKMNNEEKLNEVIRKMMTIIIIDLCEQSKKNIDLFAPRNLEEVRLCPPLISFSGEMQDQILKIRTFSRQEIYNNPRIIKMSDDARKIIFKLFNYFLKNDEYFELDNKKINEKTLKERKIADYIAGMTDRYAINLADRIAG